jgi:hypothetical protein
LQPISVDSQDAPPILGIVAYVPSSRIDPDF